MCFFKLYAEFASKILETLYDIPIDCKFIIKTSHSTDTGECSKRSVHIIMKFIGKGTEILFYNAVENPVRLFHHVVMSALNDFTYNNIIFKNFEKMRKRHLQKVIPDFIIYNDAPREIELNVNYLFDLDTKTVRRKFH